MKYENYIVYHCIRRSCRYDSVSTVHVFTITIRGYDGVSTVHVFTTSSLQSCTVIHNGMYVCCIHEPSITHLGGHWLHWVRLRLLGGQDSNTHVFEDSNKATHTMAPININQTISEWVLLKFPTHLLNYTI